MDKLTAINDAISKIKDGQTIMVGGFGVPGTPFMLIETLLEQGTKHLTLIKNEANIPQLGVSSQENMCITDSLGLMFSANWWR